MKPLVDINGKTMLQRVWERALLSSAQEVIIATDHHDIQNVAKGFGAEVCMTKIDHESGTDRLQEVASIFGYDESRIIVNVQRSTPGRQINETQPRDCNSVDLEVAAAELHEVLLDCTDTELY